MFNWLKNYVNPPNSPELNDLYQAVKEAKIKHDIVYDEFQAAADRMLRRMDRAHRVVGNLDSGKGQSQ